MPISGRKHHYKCGKCGGNLSQVHPSFNMFRCAKCKDLVNLLVNIEGAQEAQEEGGDRP